MAAMQRNGHASYLYANDSCCLSQNSNKMSTRDGRGAGLAGHNPS